MKIRQTVEHFAVKQALQLPGAGDLVRGKLVDLHTGYFLEEAPPDRREERREHLEALFDASMDVYLAALDAGFPEAEAREITHVIANFDFYRHGWTEMMEYPTEEVGEHYERYADFFEAHGIDVADPLGEFAPPGGLPDAPGTPEKLADGEQPNAEGGYADDVYVEDGEGEVTRGADGE